MRGGGGGPVPTLFNQKMGLFIEKIICLEQPQMQNKHHFLFSFLGIPTYGEGGGSSWLGQIPNFYRKSENLIKLFGKTFTMVPFFVQIFLHVFSSARLAATLMLCRLVSSPPTLWKCAKMKQPIQSKPVLKQLRNYHCQPRFENKSFRNYYFNFV